MINPGIINHTIPSKRGKNSRALEVSGMPKINEEEFNESLVQIPLLTEENYPEWVLRMKIYLRHCELLGICTTPPPHSPDADYKKKMYEAVNIITGRLSSSSFMEVIDTENEVNPYLMWQKINSHFGMKSAAIKAKVWLEFTRLPFDGDLKSFTNACRQSLREVHSVDPQIPLDVLVCCILGKIPKRYHHIVDPLIHDQWIMTSPYNTLARIEQFDPRQDPKSV
ncbi:hypothetical protein, variant [Puccinia triticina 1-1 BBBD Race 1]|uniref:DUF4219 domain-containing protein n=2 Tax=Puccinia triticina TaxID=208348 RepID=A0A180G0F6_PUCT1|nr:uncharacterized protein PtA15_6A858 [Puccinia triticina]OAV86136.1 hypothetical protein PTTG_30063 [Puccinia triticina 1-1 BBBD Race 1]OAV86137.1 hypothetical protein, variant [Puccinia triticina 1-1 BBBD Race 1]WAQ86226.1 hypothetical protein PtA15_6A858 [Puccinia triticina]WAR56111.1 hypothetical protein PtB15_6B856 [Puccinia triticina]